MAWHCRTTAWCTGLFLVQDVYTNGSFFIACALFIPAFVFPLCTRNEPPLFLLPSTKVQRMLKVMDEVEAPMLPTFNYHFSELSRLYIEAKDNVK